jgi:hypothetical protein
MKKLFIALLGLSLFAGASFAGNVSEADQKWLGAVEKMVAQGKMEISTASEERLALAKNWAASKGYETAVKKTEAGYRVTFSKALAAK